MVEALGWYGCGGGTIEGVEVVRQHLEDVGGRMQEVGGRWLRKGKEILRKAGEEDDEF